MDITLKEVAKKIITDIESIDVSQRRDDEYKAYKVSEGAQKEFVTDRLMASYEVSYKKMAISDVSFSGKILSKQSKAYKESPIRHLENETAQERQSEIYQDGKFDLAYKEFDKDFNRQRFGLLWVCKEEEQFKLRSLKGFEFAVIRDQETGELIAVILNYPDTTITGGADGVEQLVAEDQADTSAQTKVYAMWTATHQVVWKVTITKDADNNPVKEMYLVPNEENPTNLNPLERLPFVFASKSSAIDLPFINPLTDQSIELNARLSCLLTASEKHGFGQFVLKKPEGLDLSEIEMGWDIALTLPLKENVEQQPDASYINANPDLTGMSQVIYDYAEAVASEHGLDMSAIKGTKSFSSGIERLISQSDVQDIISSNQQIYADVETEVYSIVQAYLESEGENILKDQDMSVSFQKPKVLITDKEVLENIEKRMALGLITQKEALQIIDPNLNDNKVKTFFGDEDGQDSEDG